jgi:hypothetical protein
MKIVREHIEFTRGLDPKAAMGTGLIEQWKKYMETIANYDCTWVYERDFKDTFCDRTYNQYASFIVRIIYHTLKEIVYNKKLPEAAFDKVCIDEDLKKMTSIYPAVHYTKIRKKIAEILEKKFSIIVK